MDHSDPGVRSLQRRISIRFSGRAGRAACLVADDERGLVVEAWSLRGAAPIVRQLPRPVPETERTQLTPTEDGRVLVVRSSPGVHRASLLAADAAGVHETELGAWEVPAVRALPSVEPGSLAWLVVVGPDGVSALHRVDAHRGVDPAAVRISGRIGGESWLRGDGGLLAVNRVAEDQRAVLLVDARRGTVEPWPGTGTEHAVLLGSPVRRGAVFAEAGSGGLRLSWRTPYSPRPRFLPGPGWEAAGPTIAVAGRADRPPARPIAIDPTGRLLAMTSTDGARSLVWVLDIEGGGLTPVALPGGVVRSAGWAADGLRLAFGSPVSPTAITGPTRPPGYVVDASDPGGWPPAAAARTERFEGAAGPVEAVVYGDWLASPLVVVALHGGPEAAWELTYDPTLRALADAGAAVVAPNQRGSVGYGAGHREAIRGAWGGPDLDDVVALLRSLAARRDVGSPPPVLLGFSYGAFLAVLAAAAEPTLTSGCVAVAPFASGRRLHRVGSPAVRALIERLGGDRPFRDGRGERDLVKVGSRLRTPVMVIHGDRDDIVPADHVRELVDRLVAAGARVDHRVVPGGGHNPLDEPGAHSLRTEVADFAARTASAAAARVEALPCPV